MNYILILHLSRYRLYVQFCGYCCQPILAANIVRHCEQKHKNIAKVISEGDEPVKPMFHNWYELVYNLPTTKPIYNPPFLITSRWLISLCKIQRTYLCLCLISSLMICSRVKTLSKTGPSLKDHGVQYAKVHQAYSSRFQKTCMGIQWRTFRVVR